MSKRTRISGLLSIIAVACVAVVCIQGKEVSQLRSQRTQLLQGSSAQFEPPEGSQQATVVNSPATDQQAELLQLRNEISQLNRRKLELAKASDENTRLKAELQAKTSTAKSALPSGYIRQSQAVMSGFARPEDTLQTFLFAIRTGDTNTLLESIGPQLRPQYEHARLEELKAFIGAGITGRTNLSDGTIRLSVQVVPEMPTIGIQFRYFNGGWKIEKLE